MTAHRRRLRKPLFIGAIVVVLATVATLSLVGLTRNAQARACEQEYRTLQAALLAYMADNNIDTVPVSSGTSDMSTPVPLYFQSSTQTKPRFVRDSQTQWLYVWDTMGTITRIGARRDGPSVPDGCIVSPP